MIFNICMELPRISVVRYLLLTCADLNITVNVGRHRLPSLFLKAGTWNAFIGSDRDRIIVIAEIWRRTKDTVSNLEKLGNRALFIIESV